MCIKSIGYNHQLKHWKKHWKISVSFILNSHGFKIGWTDRNTYNKWLYDKTKQKPMLNAFDLIFQEHYMVIGSYLMFKWYSACFACFYGEFTWLPKYTAKITDKKDKIHVNSCNLYKFEIEISLENTNSLEFTEIYFQNY